MPPPFWARPRFVLASILAYLLAHFAIRMAMGHALSVDDAEQALFSQHYAWAYRYKAPPLFTWLLATLSLVLPVGAVATALLRYALLGAILGFSYLSARRLLADPRLAALSVYSFAAINIFAEASHRNLVHTTALGAFVAIAWYVFLRLAAAPRLGWYLALGAVFGLGMLAKWNFVLLALPLPLACLISAAGRRLVLTWKIVPAAALAAVLVLPTLLATLRMGPLPGEDIGSVLEIGSASGPAQVLAGTLSLLNTAWIYSLPLLPIVIIVLGLPLWRGLRTGAASGEVRPFPDARLVGMTMLIGLGICWALVPGLGATDFKLRYLYPVLLILPVWLFMIIERGRPSDLAINIFALAMAVLAIGVTGKRALTQLTDMISCGLCLEMQPYRPLAAQLADAGYGGDGTILASNTIAGNLRVVFPRARIIDPAYPDTDWPVPAGEGQCLVVWQPNEGPSGTPPTRTLTHLERALHGDPEAPHREGVVSAPVLYPAKGKLDLNYRLYDGPTGDCR